MLNAEKYKNFLIRYKRNFGISEKAEIPFACENHLFTFIQKDCRNCKWRYEWSCDKKRVEWMASECKEGVIALSKLEYDLLIYITKHTYYRFLIRNKNRKLELRFDNPKKVNSDWCNTNLEHDYLPSFLFNFVDYGDEQPTCISDILNDCEVIDDANN